MRGARIAGATVALATAVALVGCSHISAAQLDEIETELAALPGVTAVSTSVYSFFGDSVTVEVDAAPRPGIVDSVVEGLCELRMPGSPQLVLTLIDEPFRAGNDVGSPTCRWTGLDLPAQLDALIATGIPAAVAGTVGDPAAVDEYASLRIQPESKRMLDTLRIAEAVLPTVTQRRVFLGAEDLQIGVSDTAEAVAVVDDLLVADPGGALTGVRVDDEGVVLTLAEGAIDPDEFRAALVAREPARWGDAVVTTEAAGTVDSTATQAVVDLRDAVFDATGRTAFASADEISLTVDDTAEIADLSTTIAGLNSSGVSVRLTSGDFAPAATISVPTTAADNPYPRWVSWWEALAATGVLSKVVVGPDSLEVRSLDWGSADQRAALSEVAVTLADRDGIARVVVAGETLRG